ncbi:PilZ domain-containing protein [Oceaniserpentilla sp. 4NH20-0058]|uniref:PilZ domain-containing protein n=1 Tax=Oceaniserpentilla sp. 4NH20-0058 TaxID=3127660 RepID=UPI0031067A21
MSEHRNFTRVAFDADTSVSQGNHKWPVELIDVSLNGVLFKQPEVWNIHPGNPLVISIHLADRTHIKMEARLVHITPKFVGCKCIHIDLDSITLLKRLIELNVGSDEFLERELTALISEHGED